MQKWLPLLAKWFPVAVVGGFFLWIVSTLLPVGEKTGTFAYRAFGRIPVVANGRTQPLDSLARNSLLELCEKQTLKIEPWKSDSPSLTAIAWLAEVMFNPPLADTRPVFRIDNPDVKGLLGVPMEADPAKMLDGKHYSWAQMRGKLKEMQSEAERVSGNEMKGIKGIDASKRTPYEQAVVRVFNSMGNYMRLENMVEPQDARNWQQEYESFRANLSAGIAAVRAEQAKQPFDNEALERTARDFERFNAMAQFMPPLPVPPVNPAVSRTTWLRTGEALMNVARGETPSPSIEAYARMASAFREGRVADFNAAVADYHGVLSGEFVPEQRKVAHEQYFNSFQPFLHAMVIYLVAGLCAFGFWFAPQQLEWLRKTSAWLVVLALAVHTTGLIFRMALEGRPPVTNLYSSAIFIGWGACILGLVLERFWRNSIGLVVSATVGFLTLIIAHHLSLTGDTMEMMRAVLDTNFWLATHVVVVTLGYASTFVAGFLAIIYILRDSVSEGLPREMSQAMSKMVYGIVCFATLFSFVGTVLGGIWADQSWGRFWGWDPKENGALIIVLWNALILHARWGGLVRERGLMVLAIGGNIVTSWSWFGVNMLGIGLHSYGFTDAAFRWLMAFVVSQLCLIALALLRPLLRRSSGAPAAHSQPQAT